MVNKYFNITIKPEIPVAALSAGNISDTEIMWDWFGFDIPKGAARLIGVTALYLGKNGARYAPTDFELIWAKGQEDGTDPPSLGTPGAGVTSFGWFNFIQGKTYVDASTGANDDDLVVGSVISTQAVSSGIAAAASVDGFAHTSSLVLQGDPDSGTNVGYDKIYVGCIAKGTHNWGASTLTIDGATVTTSRTVTVADVDGTKSVGPGDILRDEDNQLIGTVKTVPAATTVKTVDLIANASANDKVVYNTTPITLVLSFES